METQEVSNVQEGLHPTMPASWSWISRLQNWEIKISVVYNPSSPCYFEQVRQGLTFSIMNEIHVICNTISISFTILEVQLLLPDILLYIRKCLAGRAKKIFTIFRFAWLWFTPWLQGVDHFSWTKEKLTCLKICHQGGKGSGVLNFSSNQ